MPKRKKPAAKDDGTYSASLVLRVPPSLPERLEAHAAKHSQAGAKFTRADAARVLLLEALDRAEGRMSK